MNNGWLLPPVALFPLDLDREMARRYVPSACVSSDRRSIAPILLGVTVLFRAKHTLSDKAACRARSAQVPLTRKDLYPLHCVPLSPLLPHKHDSPGGFPESMGL